MSVRDNVILRVGQFTALDDFRTAQLLQNRPTYRIMANALRGYMPQPAK
jgi:hypothetical protein